MTQHARVVVIGGGAMGVSALYHLAKLGWSDVMLIEKNDLTHGSTWHAAGLCTHFAHSPTIMEMGATSVRLYSKILEEETGHAVSFHACGALRVTRNPDRMSEFKHVQDIGKFVGYDFHIITPNELRDLHPLAETGDGLLGGIYEPLDGYVDPSQATLAMAAGARKYGARILRQTPVTNIEQQLSGEWAISIPGGDVICEHIINAAGTWCREIGTMMGIELPVVPMLHQYLVTDRVEAVATMKQELPIIRDPEESWYVRQERDGLICGPYEKDAVPWSIDGVPPDFGADLLPPDLDRVAHIVEAAMGRVPALAEAGIKTVVNGPITFTPDANPLIGPAYNLTNAWLLTGSSMGIMEGGGAGKFLAEWIINGSPAMDPIAVDSRRFGGYAADRSYRVAKATECFGLQFGVHYPREERAAARPVRTSPVHESMLSAGAVMGAAYGLERPNWFSTKTSGDKTIDTFSRPNWFDAVADECRAVNEDVAVADLSAFSVFDISGSDAERFLEDLGANRPPRSIGRIGLIHALSIAGGVLSEFSVVRLAHDHYRLFSAAASRRCDKDLLRERSDGMRVQLTDQSESWGAIGVMGPNAQKLMSEVTDTDLSHAAFPWLSSQIIEIASVAVLAMRVSYVGSAGFELHAPMSKMPKIFAALRAVDYFGFYGAFAMDAMRIEKGYRAWGSDLTTERTPTESGLGFLVKTEGRKFIGRDALLRRADASDRWRMELLMIDGVGPDPFYGHTIFRDDKPVGVVTSGTYGHRTEKVLALAFLTDGAKPNNSELNVSVLGETRPIRVLKSPAYDADNLLTRSP